MTTQHTPVDRTGWPKGAWDDEPDRIEFEHAGLPCLMRRALLGNWCGYAAVPPGHPLHGLSFDNGKVCSLVVHGDVNHASPCHGDVCHVPKPGEPADVWWFGFDFAHGFDLIPYVAKLSPGLARDLKYRDVAYVRAQVERFAEQLRDSAHSVPSAYDNDDHDKAGCDCLDCDNEQRAQETAP